MYFSEEVVQENLHSLHFSREQVIFLQLLLPSLYEPVLFINCLNNSSSILSTEMKRAKRTDLASKLVQKGLISQGVLKQTKNEFHFQNPPHSIIDATDRNGFALDKACHDIYELSMIVWQHKLKRTNVKNSMSSN